MLPCSMRTLTVKIPETLDATITAVAKRRRTTRSVVVREALSTVIDAEEVTMAELIGGLAGCIDGEADLSTHPRHMAGFGA